MSRGRAAVATAAVLTLVGCGDAPSPQGTDGALPPIQAERQRPLTDRTFEATRARLQRGRHLANGILQCASCHSPVDSSVAGHPPLAGREFSGAVLWDDEGGDRVVAPNLTPDSATGAGAWPDDALARAIRVGVGHDGRALSLPMYWESFRNLSDEDLASVIVYLRSLPAIANPLPRRRLSPEREAELARVPFPLHERVPERDLSTPLALGSYLVDVADCVGCHTGWEAPTLPGVFAGGNHVWDEDSLPVVSKNITPDPSGIGSLSAEDFRWVMRTGRGGTLHPIMRWRAFANLTDEELDALQQALNRVEPVAHVVGNGMPPTLCPVCGQRHGLGEANPPPAPLVGLPLDTARARDYLGTYHHPGWDVALSVTRTTNGGLAASEGGPPVALVRIGDELFRGRGLPSPIRVERDGDGAVIAALYQEIREERFDRVDGG
ncbi:MAG: c-type cytochrome [Longimicrobiales bacterium]